MTTRKPKTGAERLAAATAEELRRALIAVVSDMYPGYWRDDDVVDIAAGYLRPAPKQRKR